MSVATLLKVICVGPILLDKITNSCGVILNEDLGGAVTIWPKWLIGTAPNPVTFNQTFSLLLIGVITSFVIDCGATNTLLLALYFLDWYY